MPGRTKKSTRASSKSSSRMGKLHQEFKTLELQMNGRGGGLASDPRAIHIAPWYSNTLESVIDLSSTSAGHVTYTVHDLFESFYSTTGLLVGKIDESNIGIRLISFKLWDLSESPTAYIQLSPYSLSTRTYSYNDTIDDSAGKNHFAAVKYCYPRSEQLVIWKANQLDVELASISTENATRLLLRVSVQWRAIFDNKIPAATTTGWKHKSSRN